MGNEMGQGITGRVDGTRQNVGPVEMVYLSHMSHMNYVIYLVCIYRPNNTSMWKYIASIE